MRSDPVTRLPRNRGLFTHVLGTNIASMEHPANESRPAPRALSDYWTAFCAVLLLLIVVYAVFTSS